MCICVYTHCHTHTNLHIFHYQRAYRFTPLSLKFSELARMCFNLLSFEIFSASMQCVLSICKRGFLFSLARLFSSKVEEFPPPTDPEHQGLVLFVAVCTIPTFPMPAVKISPGLMCSPAKPFGLLIIGPTPSFTAAFRVMPQHVGIPFSPCILSPRFASHKQVP